MKKLSGFIRDYPDLAGSIRIHPEFAETHHCLYKHWKKFIKASTEGKFKEKTEQEKVSLHMGTQAQESLEGLSFEVKLKKKRKNKKIT